MNKAGKLDVVFVSGPFVFDNAKRFGLLCLAILNVFLG